MVTTGRPRESLPDRLAGGWNGRAGLDGWEALTTRLGAKIQLVGDDNFVTNSTLLQKGIDRGSPNSVLIKLNQIGTLSETLDTKCAWPTKSLQHRNLAPFRRNETCRSRIWRRDERRANERVAPRPRSERVAKYNQLLRLEEQLGDQAVF